MDIYHEVSVIYICLKYLVIDGEEVVDWISRKLENDTTIPDDLYEIPFISNHDSKAIEEIIGKINGLRIDYCTFCVVVNFIYYRFTEGYIDYLETIKLLYRVMVNNGYLSFNQVDISMIHHFDDGYNLAINGIYGNVDELVLEFCSWFEDFIRRNVGTIPSDLKFV